jgi:hypothetical protein
VTTTIDRSLQLDSVAFQQRLADLLKSTRRRRRLALRSLASSSFRSAEVKRPLLLESGLMSLDEEIVESASELYGADLGLILASRSPVVVTSGLISVSGVTTSFVPKNSTSLLTAYLRLIRTIRRQRKAAAIVLRRDDIEALANYLDEPGEIVVDRLGALMGATVTQRRAMAGRA